MRCTSTGGRAWRSQQLTRRNNSNDDTLKFQFMFTKAIDSITSIVLTVSSSVIPDLKPTWRGEMAIDYDLLGVNRMPHFVKTLALSTLNIN